MWYNNGAADVPIGAVAFVTTFPTASGGGNLASGTQQFNVVPIDTSALNTPKGTAIAAINGHVADSSTVGPGASPINP